MKRHCYIPTEEMCTSDLARQSMVVQLCSLLNVVRMHRRSKLYRFEQWSHNKRTSEIKNAENGAFQFCSMCYPMSLENAIK